MRPLLAVDDSSQSASTYTRVACELLRAGLEPLGYRYCKTKRCLLRRRGEFALLVSVHGESQENSARLLVRADVYSRKLRAFRARHASPISRGGRVAGGLLHLLAKPAPDLVWNPNSREEFHDVVVRTLETIYQVALPYFDTLSNLDELAEDLEQEEIPGLDPKDAFELLLCYDHVEDASAFLRHWWQRYSQVVLATSDSAAQDFGLEREQARELATLMRHYGITH